MTTLIIDANNLAYRARYTFFLTNGDEDVSVTWGVLYTLTSMLKRFKPDSVIFCWDGGVPKDRKQALKSYKAHRKKDDKDEDWINFWKQLEVLHDALPMFGVTSVKVRGVEADDLMYHASRIIDGECVIVSGDADMLQAVTVDDRVQVHNPMKEYTVNYSNFEDLVGISYNMYMDYKIMRGDSSDGIAGIAGIGDTYAKAVLESYGTLSNAMHMARYSYNWLAPSRAKKPLEEAEEAYIAAVRSVIDLSEDRYKSADAVQMEVERWKPCNAVDIKRFMVSKSFARLLDTVALFKTLEAPHFKGVETKNYKLIVERI